MSPGKLRDQTLKTLRAPRRKMLTAAWTGSLRRVDRPTRRRAAHALLEIQAAIDFIEQAELLDMRDTLIENEVEILRGTERLERALQNMNRVKTVLGAAEFLLALGARIAPLLL